MYVYLWYVYLYTWEMFIYICEIMAENFVSIIKLHSYIFQKLRISNRIYSKNTTPKHIKLLKTKEGKKKKKNLWKQLQKIKKVKMIVNISSEAIIDRDSEATLLKHLKKERTVNLEFYIQWKCLINAKWK